MGASRCGRNLALLMLALGRDAWAEPHADAELTTVLQSENLLGDEPAEPPPWEALGSVRSGRESRVRFALDAEDAGFVPALSTTARLRFELGLDGLGAEQTPTPRDLSSCLGFS